MYLSALKSAGITKGHVYVTSPVEATGESALAGIMNSYEVVTDVEIPESVKQINEYAFYNCTNLLTVNVDNVESNLTLGEKWYPTNNGLEINELVINWKK